MSMLNYLLSAEFSLVEGMEEETLFSSLSPEAKYFGLTLSSQHYW